MRDAGDRLRPLGTSGRRLLISGLRLLPKNLLSRAAGHLADIPLPGPLRRPLLQGFGRLVGVDFFRKRTSPILQIEKVEKGSATWQKNAIDLPEGTCQVC